MHEIQLVAIKFIKYLLIASLIPPIVLLIIAAYNERLRRVLLWILAPLAAIAVVAFLIFAPQHLQTVEDWQRAFAGFKSSFLAWLPFLIGLAVLGLAALLFGPAVRQAAENSLLRRARREYLEKLLAWVEPQLAGKVELEGRIAKILAERPEVGQEIESKEHLCITGEPGSGKSTLLRGLLREAARQALASSSRPLPIWIDLDERLASPEGLTFSHLEAVLPVQTRLLGRLLESEGAQHRLAFFIDSSIQNYALTVATTGDFQEAREVTGQLAKLIESVKPCPFILAMPPGVEGGTLKHLVEKELALAPLSAEGIQSGIQALTEERRGDGETGRRGDAVTRRGRAAGAEVAASTEADGSEAPALLENYSVEAAGEASEAPESPRHRVTASPRLPVSASPRLSSVLLEDEGIWRGLAGRPAFLYWLVRFYNKNNRLPKDVRELFREVVYPSKLTAGQVETALIHLTGAVISSRQYWQPIKTAGDLSTSMLVKVLPEISDRRRAEKQIRLKKVCFAHPIFLAYSIALAWQADQITPLPGQDTQPPAAAWPKAGQMEAFQADPILADALVFFNNIESDPQRVSTTISRLIETGSAQDETGPFRVFLAAQCLLALPTGRRPLALVTRVAIPLIEELADNPEAAAQLTQLMEPLDKETRIGIYTHVLAKMEETHLERTLRRIKTLGAGEAADPSDILRALLWHGSEASARTVGNVWAASEPREAVGLFKELFEHGPAGRRALAVDLLGQLPQEAVGDYLRALLKEEREPALRIAILRSLGADSAETIFPLLEIIGSRQELDEVRIYAAELLASSQLLEGRGSPQIRTPGVAREIVRISHIPMPERAQSCIRRLLEALRGIAPENMTRWEEMVNPYIVGRPVTEPHLFFGREALLRDLCLAVDNATPILLTGEHGSGKTSLLYRLAAALNDEAARGVPVRAIQLDLAGLQPHEFYETVIRALIEGLHDPALSADPNVPRPYNDQHFAKDLGDLLEYTWASLGPNSRLALLVDEGDGLLAYPPVMHAALRRILNGAVNRGLVMILAGTDALCLGQSQGQGSGQQPDPPFFSTFLHLVIPRLSREEAQRLIVEPVAGTFQYQPAALESILQAAQGRPDAVQAACQRLISRMLEVGEREITAQRAAEVLQPQVASPRAELLSQTENVLGSMMDWLEAHPEATAQQVEEQVRRAWSELQKAIVQQVTRARKVLYLRFMK